MVSLRIDKLVAALTDSTSTKTAAARQLERNINMMNDEQMNAYWARHYYFDI